MKISVIVPALNEEARIADVLKRARVAAGQPVEIVVVDGQSSDGTIRAARVEADKVAVSPKAGRAFQMHLGALESSGDLLLFLHADTALPDGWAGILRRAFERNPAPAATAFRLSFDHPGLFYRMCAFLAHWRSVFTGVPYGDQAIAVPREIYFSAGGFPDAPLMEEYLFLPKLKRRGGVRILPERITTSARRYERRGRLRNAFKNIGLVILFYAGVPPEKLARLY